MFSSLGHLASRRWIVILIGWFLCFGTIKFVAPNWKDAARDGEFDHLPKEMDSIRGEKRFAEAFPEDLLASSAVIVIRREAGPLTDGDDDDNDLAFIEYGIRDGLLQIQNEIDEQVLQEQLDIRQSELGEEKFRQQKEQLRREIEAQLAEGPISDSRITQITQIRSPSDEMIGEALLSEDGHAALVIVELSKKFLEYGNRPTIDKIEQLIAVPGGTLFKKGKPEDGGIPPGLVLRLAGTATVGRDMLIARDDSAAATETWTVGLVILLLALIYRAPLLALIPLITVGVANEVSLSLASLLSQYNARFHVDSESLLFGFRTFVEMNVYITVILYGAGVDYCLFLIARYKEELDRGANLDEAVSAAVAKVGSALVASATTTAFGIGMMVLAEFGKFRNAGIAIAMSLIVVLIASLTLTPALLRMFGRAAFWPHIRSERINATAGWISGSTLMAKLIESNPMRSGWEKIADAVTLRPAKLWGITLALMLPFALVGALFWNDLSYGLLSELPPESESVVGTAAVAKHFPEGTVGPLTVLLENDQVDFGAPDHPPVINNLVARIKEKQTELGIHDIRWSVDPLGSKNRPRGGTPTEIIYRRGLIRAKGPEYYVTQVEGRAGNATRLDIIFNTDPFAKESIGRLDGVAAAITEFIEEQAAPFNHTRVSFIGATANIRDLKETTDSDRIVIDIAVLSVVLFILWLLLKRFAISLYLILTVLFSYFVTLGLTYIVFWYLEPSVEFAGLDWKVPIFLFTFLIAVGEDYNIYLMTRIDEEQRLHGAVQGIRRALLRTGGIISSCGIIMAGTFSSLVLGGSLRGMQQLGFALALGVLLDSFVVRPILVPTYLTMLHRGDFGRWSALLGAPTEKTEVDTPKSASEVQS